MGPNIISPELVRNMACTQTDQFVVVGDVRGETKPSGVDEGLAHVELRRMDVVLLTIACDSRKSALHFGEPGDSDVAFDVTPGFPPRQHVHERRLPRATHAHQSCQHPRPE